MSHIKKYTIKALDSVDNYEIRWVDVYSKSKGYPRSDYFHLDTIKAKSLNEALSKLAKNVALNGIGTYNANILSISNSKYSYNIGGRLSELIKQSFEDSVKDEATPLDVIYTLIKDEEAARDSYNIAISNLAGKIPDISLKALVAIRDDEKRHIENLYAIVNGTVTEKNLED